jgi:pSer/pThr/pTyr-binding forkhead associated (FHA) protein
MRARAARIVTQDTLVLVPTGDGSVEHLDKAVELPGMLELKEGTYTLGRSEPADLVIAVPTVSAKHAELKVAGGQVTVTDLNSTNGTFIEEEEIEANTPNELPLGAEIIFGDTFLAKFCLEER